MTSTGKPSQAETCTYTFAGSATPTGPRPAGPRSPPASCAHQLRNSGRRKQMFAKMGRHGILAAALGFALAIAVPGAAAAAPSHALEFAAGEACTFSLAIDVHAAGKRVTQEHNGVMVSTGTAAALTFINLATGESVSFRSNGAVQIAEPAGGGRTTLTLDGHNVVILFPSDTTAGPSTTLH